jgi:hypothetical protein
MKDPILYVEWEDARGVHQEWTDLEELKAQDTCRCHSVGRLLRENKKEIVLVPHWYDDPASGCGEMAIPKGAIKKRKKLR